MTHDELFRLVTLSIDFVVGVTLVIGMAVSMGGVLTEIYLRGYYRCKRLIESKGVSSRPAVENSH